MNKKYFKVSFKRQRGSVLRLIDAKCIAYKDPPAVKLPIGSRVIALFQSDLHMAQPQIKEGPKGLYFPGIIAETLQDYSKYR